MSAIFLIAFERCCLTTLWGLHQKHLTVRRQIGLCVAFSVYFLVWATAITLIADIESRQGGLVLKFKDKRVLYALSIPTYALITCGPAFCYFRICIFLWKHRTALVSNQNSSSQKNFQKEKKTTALIAIILTVYLTGTLPSFVYTLILGNNPKFLKLELWQFLRFLWCATSLVDIAMYAWKVPEFQEGYRKILCFPRRVRTIRVAPRSNVQHLGINLPLEPRREVWTTLFGSSAPTLETGTYNVMNEWRRINWEWEVWRKTLSEHSWNCNCYTLQQFWQNLYELYTMLKEARI